MMKDGDTELLCEIARFEASVDFEKDYRIGWSWRHVKIWPATLNRLFKEGYIENVFRSNSYTGYRLTELGKSLALNLPEAAQKPQNQKLELADNLFEDIIGHEDIKELLMASLLAERPVHVLLTGPPALAKTLFLWDIERACGEKAIWWWGRPLLKPACGTWWLNASRRYFSSMR
jgi:Holliday junction DNA helicase RuvB